MFPFELNSVKINSRLTVRVDAIHQHIGTLLTAERKIKIDRVAAARNFNNALILENIYDRGNASAVMRTAEALGFANLQMIELGDKFKESQRTTAGADKWVEVKKWKSTQECIANIKAQGKRLVVTHLSQNAKNISEVDFSQPTALVLGNEKEGVSAEMIAAADDCVLLPMVGFVQSYNISVAGALAMYHIFLDRTRRLGYSQDLNAEQTKRLQAEYYLRTLDSAEKILMELNERGQLP